MRRRATAGTLRRTAVATFSLAALFPAVSARAQARFEITGVVVDSAGAGVGGAMVVALALPDSVLTKWDTTGGDGAFTLGEIVPGNYILQVSLIGHRTVRRELAVTDANVAAGRIPVEVLAVEVDPLVIKVEHVPFLNRRDTLAYNALAFETRPNATVEDLLRRLPGIEVAEDGSITAQGEDVQNVLVDGKEFFGSDPTIATKNLPADAVQQVQVYDKESDMAEFTGIADGQEERTINLELKEEAKTGYFGRVSGGVGADMGNYGSIALPAEGGISTDNRVPYEGVFSINRFSPTTQLAALGNVNNTGQAGFSWGDFQNFAGGSRALVGGEGRGGGSNDGFTETLALGLNASHDFAEDTWIRSSYFLSTLDNVQNSALLEQQLFGSEVASLLDRTTSEHTDNLQHQLDVNAQVRFAEGHELRLRGSLNARSSSLASIGMGTTRTVEGGLLNSSTSDYGVDGNDLGGDARLTWRKRLSENGRSVVAEVRANLDDNDRLADLASTVAGDPLDPDAVNRDVLQEQADKGKTFGRSVRLSLTEPLSTSSTLEVFGERRAVDEDQSKSVYDVGSGSRVFNDLESSGFERTYSYLQGGLRFNRSGERVRVGMGVEVQHSNLDGTILDRDERIANGYTHLLPSADLRIELSEGKNVRMRYATSTREPSMTQLQPFADNSDPLRIYTGNPDLRPEYTHRVNVDYRLFDQFSFRNLFAYASLNYTANDISQARSVDDEGVQTRSPVNSGGAWSANGGLNFGTPLRWLGARVTLNYQLGYSSSTEILNDAANDSRNLRNTFGIDIENRSKNLFDIRAGTSLTWNDVHYSLNEELNQSYLNGTIRASGSLYLGGWTLSSDFNYRMFDRDVFGSGRNIAFWQATVSRLFLDDRAELQLTGFDLLNQNQGVNFSSSASSIREQRTESLGQLVMLRFLYHLGPQGMRGGGPRIDRRR